MSEEVYELTSDTLVDRENDNAYLLIFKLEWLDDEAEDMFKKHVWLFDKWTFISKKPKLGRTDDSDYKVTLEYDQHTDPDASETLEDLLLQKQWTLKYDNQKEAEAVLLKGKPMLEDVMAKLWASLEKKKRIQAEIK